MEQILETLKRQIAEHPPNFGDGESVLTMLYECHNENNPYDNEQIRADFNELYQQMNGMPLREVDNIVYPVCRLCRDHEKVGFIEGIRLGVLLAQEVSPLKRLPAAWTRISRHIPLTPVMVTARTCWISYTKPTQNPMRAIQRRSVTVLRNWKNSCVNCRWKITMQCLTSAADFVVLTNE